MFKNILPNSDDLAVALPGDERISSPTVIIDSAFNLDAKPEEIFPWLLQLGKRRAGWYLPHSIERFMPPSKRGLRSIVKKWQQLEVGQRIPDYGGRKGYLECFYLKPNEAIGYTAVHGKLTMTWVLSIWPVNDHSRVIIRLRMKTAKKSRPVLWSIGKLFDRLTIAGLAAGLKERLSKTS